MARLNTRKDYLDCLVRERHSPPSAHDLRSNVRGRSRSGSPPRYQTLSLHPADKLSFDFDDMGEQTVKSPSANSVCRAPYHQNARN